MSFENRAILVGVTGSIAAYKAAELVSKLVQRGADVEVILTRNAQRFISSLTFRSLLGKKVFSESSYFKDINRAEHVYLGKKAELFVIAPATANTIAKLTYGIADNLLTTVALNFKPSSLIIAPAMNENMYLSEINQKNISILKERGVHIIPPEEGFLACSHKGVGRLASLSSILDKIEELLKKKTLLKGKVILVTAGATQERIDPIRYITNGASGRLGYSLAELATDYGADVILVSTTSVNLVAPPVKEFYKVVDAEQLHAITKDVFDRVDIVFFTAAVSDYKPKNIHKEKLKSGQISLDLVKTYDILRDLGKNKKNQVLVGFSVDTEVPLEEAKKKLEYKNLDFIVACTPESMGGEFAEATIISKDGTINKLPNLEKRELASRLLEICILG